MSEKRTKDTGENNGGIKLVLCVVDPATAWRFYADVFGWERVGTSRENDSGLLRLPGGELALLQRAARAEAKEPEQSGAGPTQGPAAKQPSPGDRVYVPVPDGDDALDRLKRRAEAAGAPVRDETEPSCWRTLTITTPEGYRVAFWKELDTEPGGIIELYASGPDRLEAELSGLDEPALDLTAAPGKWSIRQQVLHLVDLELASIHKLKYMMGGTEPDRVYAGNRFTQDGWAEAMHYDGRPIAVEVELFRLLREHILTLCNHIPGALERSVLVGGGHRESASRLMKSMAGHANTHIRRIREIREQHQL